jgi:hypothetical protein
MICRCDRFGAAIPIRNRGQTDKTHMQTLAKEPRLSIKPAYSPKPAQRKPTSIRAGDSPSPSESQAPVSPSYRSTVRITARR